MMKQSIPAKRARQPLVLAIDIGSSATRGGVFDADGSAVRWVYSKIKHTVKTASDGTAVCDADEVLAEAVAVVDDLVDRAGKHAGAIAGVAMDTFATSLVGVDASGKAVTPAYTYADSRPAPYARRLAQTLDERAVHLRTGCRVHAGYLPAQILWLADTQPDVLAKANAWMSLGEYVYLHLLGRRAASFSTAAWTGLLNRQTLTWDAELLEALPLRAEQLSPLLDSSEPVQGLTDEYAKRWPALREARWFPAIADGYASNVGCGALTAETWALALGTSGALRALLPGSPDDLPDGLWCYAVNRRQSLVGGAINDAGRALAWLRGVLKLPGDAKLAQLLQGARSASAPLVLPFLTGERSPGWVADARAAITGLHIDTTAADIFLGVLEGITLRLAIIAEELRSMAPGAERIIASGGAIEGIPDWGRMIADCLGLPVAPSLEGQATLKGTALLALDVLAPDVYRGTPSTGDAIQPNVEHAGAYRAALERQQALYRCVVVEGSNQPRTEHAPEEGSMQA